MAADRQQALGDGPVAISQGALDQRVLGQEWLEFAPQRDAFEQRAAFVDARQAVAQGGVHVEMRIDERRAEQIALRVDDLVRRGVQRGRDFGDAAGLHGHGHAGTAIGQRSVFDEQIKHLSAFFKKGCNQAPRLTGDAHFGAADAGG